MAHKITPKQFNDFLDWAKSSSLSLSQRAKNLKPTLVEPPAIRPIHEPPEQPREVYVFGIVNIDDNPKQPEVRIHGANHEVIRLGISPDDVQVVLSAVGFDPDALPRGLGGEQPMPNVIVEGLQHKESKAKPKAGGKR